MSVRPPALLALADGTVFRGESIGAAGAAVGEVVFNTAMTGYQEILTDPSYCRQIVTLTYPHIGNTGVNPEDVESERVYAAGLVIRDLPLLASNWRRSQDLSAYLLEPECGCHRRHRHPQAHAHPAREGCAERLPHGRRRGRGGGARAGARLPGIGRDGSGEGGQLQRQPTAGTSRSGRSARAMAARTRTRLHVVAFDYGIKRNILRKLASRGLPGDGVARAGDARRMRSRSSPTACSCPTGRAIPSPATTPSAPSASWWTSASPTFGICLGHQLLGLASGARTLKMKFGHHGANHPVQDLDSGRVMITSQNHGFAVDADTLPAKLPRHARSLFDGTLQGFARTDRPAFCFQGHPEASPGPHDVDYLFDRFIGLMEKQHR